MADLTEIIASGTIAAYMQVVRDLQAKNAELRAERDMIEQNLTDALRIAIDGYKRILATSSTGAGTQAQVITQAIVLMREWYEIAEDALEGIAAHVTLEESAE